MRWNYRYRRQSPLVSQEQSILLALPFSLSRVLKSCWFLSKSKPCSMELALLFGGIDIDFGGGNRLLAVQGCAHILLQLRMIH